MGKQYDKRLTDTIAFIRNTAVLQRNGAWRGAVADYCEEWMGKAPDALQRQISELISQGLTTDGDTNRNYRRAIALLGSVGGALQYQNFAVLSEANLKEAKRKAAISRAVRGAPFSAQLDDHVEIFLGEVGDQGFIDAMLHELCNRPLAFLSEHRLKIAGGQGGLKSYKFFVYRDGMCGDRVTYGLQATGKNFKYEPQVSVINVPATSFRDTKQKLNGLKGLDKIIGTEVKGGGACTVMTTTQFTGCSFCVQKCGTGIVAAHMDPEGVNKKTGLTGPGIRGELMAANGFAFDATGLTSALQGAPVVYGCKADGDGGWGYEQAGRLYMTIIGLYLEAGWTLFTQFNADDGTFRASQIYPRI